MSAAGDREFVRRVRLPVRAAEAFAWHERPGAFERLAPPWQRVRVVGRRWPFARWEHTHTVEPDGDEASVLEDRIRWALPLAPLAHPLAGRFVERTLSRVFAYRHRVTAGDLAAHRRAALGRLRILVSGSRGLVGSALVPFLTTGGHEVVRLVRGDAVPQAGAIVWDPERGALDARSLEGFDAVVHLAGENLAAGRWTKAAKARILESRALGTQLLAEALAGRRRRPRVLVAASAVGWYGDAGDAPCDEETAAGSGFLAAVCRAWEGATAPAARRGIRVVNLRLGFVLSPAGGGLARMLPAFRAGLGGPLGSGRQWLSWIAMDDLLGAVLHAVADARLEGPVNAVAPEPLRQAEFAHVLGGVLRRPATVPAPAFALRAAFGAMADEVLLGGCRVAPTRLQETGFVFRDPDAAAALRHLLGREG